jgi:hypothetical protein
LPASFSRGRQYFRDGGVGEIVRRGEAVSAAVEVSEIDPTSSRFGEHREPLGAQSGRIEAMNPNGPNRQKCGEGAMQCAP